MKSPDKKSVSASEQGSGGSAGWAGGAGTTSAAVGATPSNTAPANCTILRSGIDSLYVSYAGELSLDALVRLKNYKLLAQSPDPNERAQAQMPVMGHIFEGLGSGKGKFAFVLVDNWFHLQIRGKQHGKLPLAYVQISSELLTRSGSVAALEELLPIINTIGVQPDPPQVSRVDLFMDFITDIEVDQLGLKAFVCRAKSRHNYYEGRRFCGFTIGQGGQIMVRLYDKTLEITKSGKNYLRDLWLAAGWDGRCPVWRLEFQIKRPVLCELGVKSFPDLQERIPAIWAYCTQSWLRLTVVSSDDETSARWPTHPLWERLADTQAFGSATTEPVSRTRQQRIPRDSTLFVNGLAAITSFMAVEGISDVGEGLGEYYKAAERFHGPTGAALERYVGDKVAEKARRFNTYRNRSGSIAERAEVEEAAAKYRAVRGDE